MGYETNKFERKRDIEGSGWRVAWADDVAETDVFAGVVAGGISIATQNPGPFLVWLNALIDRTRASISTAIADEAKDLAADVIRDAIKNRDAKQVFKRFGAVDFKAGAISYAGRNTFANYTLTRTWGMIPYVAFRVRSTPGQAASPTISDHPTDQRPPISVNVYSTSVIKGHVNNSRDIRKYGAPVYVRVNAIDEDHDYLLVGVDVNSPDAEDPEHSKIICRFATVARALGKPLRLETSRIADRKIYVRCAAIVQDA